ncbi:hypothetical protein OIU85_004065 [Salix viminalis]|uniref:Pentatricopeptide repeat-containing protein n=1 Tax=Salix viminalis TaxID=40686 RepID=A0A9Q0PSJ9_SALVM|nr:hypothetical protein OIU85_004065 [Salix viminalis]
MQVFDEMLREGLVPTVVTYNTLIKGLCLVGRPWAAHQLFGNISTCGLTPTIITYSTLIDGFCEQGNLYEGWALFQEMQKSAVKPNLVVYTILIDGMCKCGKLKDAKVLFSRLTVEGFQPDVHTYTVLIGGVCKEGYLIEDKWIFSFSDPKISSAYRLSSARHLQEEHEKLLTISRQSKNLLPVPKLSRFPISISSNQYHGACHSRFLQRIALSCEHSRFCNNGSKLSSGNRSVESYRILVHGSPISEHGNYETQFIRQCCWFLL